MESRAERVMNLGEKLAEHDIYHGIFQSLSSEIMTQKIRESSAEIGSFIDTPSWASIQLKLKTYRYTTVQEFSRDIESLVENFITRGSFSEETQLLLKTIRLKCLERWGILNKEGNLTKEIITAASRNRLVVKSNLVFKYPTHQNKALLTPDIVECLDQNRTMWRASLPFGEARNEIGIFQSQEEATDAYDEFKHKLYAQSNGMNGILNLFRQEQARESARGQSILKQAIACVEQSCGTKKEDWCPGYMNTREDEIAEGYQLSTPQKSSESAKKKRSKRRSSVKKKAPKTQTRTSSHSIKIHPQTTNQDARSSNLDEFSSSSSSGRGTRRSSRTQLMTTTNPQLSHIRRTGRVRQAPAHYSPSLGPLDEGKDNISDDDVLMDRRSKRQRLGPMKIEESTQDLDEDGDTCWRNTLSRDEPVIFQNVAGENWWKGTIVSVTRTKVQIEYDGLNHETYGATASRWFAKSSRRFAQEQTQEQVRTAVGMCQVCQEPGESQSFTKCLDCEILCHLDCLNPKTVRPKWKCSNHVRRRATRGQS